MKKTILKLIGFVLILAGLLGMLIFSVALWIGLTDPEEMSLAVRIIAIMLILIGDAACFAIVLFGRKCMVGFKKKNTKSSAVTPQQNPVKQCLRCPQCGIRLYGVNGERIQCTFCGNKFTVDL